MDPFEKDGVKYAEYGDDGVKITYIKGNNIPSYVTWHGKTRTVKYIDSGAIRGDFTSITIPNGIKLAGDAFGNCHKLNSISFNDPNHIWKDGVLYSSDYKTIEYVKRDVTTFVIPNNVTKIGDHAFQNCKRLTTISIPNNVKSIGYGAFLFCDGLTSITIPDSVTSIGSSAFWSCERITSIKIPNSVTKIGDYAFAGCTGLTSITIPDSVTSIGDRAFAGCTGLTSITIPDSVTSIGKSAFSGCTNLKSLILPKGKQYAGSAFVDVERFLSGQMVSAAQLTCEKRISEDGHDYMAITNAQFDIAKAEIPSIAQGIRIESIEDRGFRNVKVKYLVLPDTIKDIKCYQDYSTYSIFIDISALSVSSKLATIHENSLGDWRGQCYCSLIVRDDGGTPDFTQWQCKYVSGVTLYVPVRLLVAAAKEFGTSRFKQILPLTSLPEDLKWMLTASPAEEELKTEVKGQFSIRYNNDASAVYVTSVCKTLKGSYAFPTTAFGLPIISIDKGAFDDCTELEALSMPDIYTISDDMFASCPKLKALIVRRGQKAKLDLSNAAGAGAANATLYVDVKYLVDVATKFMNDFKDIQPLESIPAEYADLLNEPTEKKKEVKSEPKPEVKAEPKPEPKPEVKAEPAAPQESAAEMEARIRKELEEKLRKEFEQKAAEQSPDSAKVESQPTQPTEPVQPVASAQPTQPAQSVQPVPSAQPAEPVAATETKFNRDASNYRFNGKVYEKKTELVRDLAVYYIEQHPGCTLSQLHEALAFKKNMSTQFMSEAMYNECWEQDPKKLAYFKAKDKLKDSDFVQAADCRFLIAMNWPTTACGKPGNFALLIEAAKKIGIDIEPC